MTECLRGKKMNQRILYRNILVVYKEIRIGAHT